MIKELDKAYKKKSIKIKRVGRHSGKSKSIQNLNGVRRTDYITGELLAPRSFRRTWKKKGRPLLSRCSSRDLRRANIIVEEKKEDK